MQQVLYINIGDNFLIIKPSALLVKILLADYTLVIDIEQSIYIEQF